MLIFKQLESVSLHISLFLFLSTLHHFPRPCIDNSCGLFTRPGGGSKAAQMVHKGIIQGWRRKQRKKKNTKVHMQLIRPSYTPVEEGHRVSGLEQAVVSFSSQSLEKSLPNVLSCLRKYFLCRRRSTQSDNLLQGNSEKVGKLDIFICCFSKKYLLSSYKGTKSMLVLLIITRVIDVKRQLCNFTVNC